MYGSTEEHPHGEDIIFYLTVYNEPLLQEPEPADVDAEGILRGIRLAALAPGDTTRPRAQLLASGVGLPWVHQAADMLDREWGVAADVWSVTSWNELARDAIACEEHNLLNPDGPNRTPYVTEKLTGAPGPVVAVSDFMRAVPNQIARWIPSDYHTLGTDGFGFADTRPAARRYFHVDAESIVVMTLEALAERGEVDPSLARKAFDQYRIDDPTATAGVLQEGADA
jgi:pyruvate dehydrogenase E1 component